MLWEHEPQTSVSIAFSSSSKLSRKKHGEHVFYFFRKYRDAKKKINLFTLLAPSLCKQLVLVLCFLGVRETRF